MFEAVLGAVDDFFYTPQEQAADALKQKQAESALAAARAQEAAARAQEAAAAANAETTKQYLRYGLVGVGVLVGGLVVYKLVAR